MEVAKKDNFFVIRLRDSEDLFSSLEKIYRENKMKFGVVVSGLGMLRRVKLGYFLGQGKYKRSKYRSVFEVVSLEGNLSLTDEGEFIAHLHTVLGKKNKKTVGGHLLSAEVHNTLELVLLDLPVKAERRFDPKTKLFGLELE